MNLVRAAGSDTGNEPTNDWTSHLVSVALDGVIAEHDARHPDGTGCGCLDALDALDETVAIDGPNAWTLCGERAGRTLIFDVTNFVPNCERCAALAAEGPFARALAAAR
jgi:hypothetical protein